MNMSNNINMSLNNNDKQHEYDEIIINKNENKLKYKSKNEIKYVKLIYDGMFNKVCLYKDNKIDNLYYAIKLYKKDNLINNKQIYKYFNIEYKLFKNMFNSTHNNNNNDDYIIKLLFYTQDYNHIYLAFSYCNNGDLLNFIENNYYFNLNKNENENENKNEICNCSTFYELYVKSNIFIISQIIAGLEYIHSLNIIHRDIKPDNMLLDDNMYIKLCDFASAKLIIHKNENNIEHKNEYKQIIDTTIDGNLFKSTSLKNLMIENRNDDIKYNFSSSRSDCYLNKTLLRNNNNNKSHKNNESDNYLNLNSKNKNESIIGTPYYMSPEMLLGEKVDFSTDLWSFGCLIHKLLFNYDLFDSNNIYEIFNKIKTFNNYDSYLALLKEQQQQEEPSKTNNRKYDDNVIKFLDLINKLIVYKPVDRLDYDRLKLHSLFEEHTNWSTLYKIQSPIKLFLNKKNESNV